MNKKIWQPYLASELGVPARKSGGTVIVGSSYNVIGTCTNEEFQSKPVRWNALNLTQQPEDITATLGPKVPAGQTPLVAVRVSGNGRIVTGYSLIDSSYFTMGWVAGLAPMALARTGNAELADFQVYPNPSSGAISITIPAENSENYNLVFTDITGRVIKRITNQTATALNVDLMEFQKGIYFVSLQSTARNSIQKIVIQ